MNGIFAGLPISLSILAFEAFVLDHPRGGGRRCRPFAVLLLLRLVVWGAAIVASLAAMRLVLPWPGAADPYWLPRDLVFGSALLFVALTVTSIDRLLGPGINVAKRLEAIARNRDARLVVSGDLIERLSGERRRRRASPMSKTAIAGKTNPIRILSVARSSAAA